jgi:protein-disulfide isomerase
MNTKTLYSIIICLFVMGGSIGVLHWWSQDADERMMNNIETAADDAKVNIAEITSETTETIIVQNKISWEAREENGALVIGSPDAPVTIMEYSSLSCPHCATFHKDTLPTLKKDYIDQGQVKFVFNDFPLNKPALAGSLLLKCVPIEDRYNFMELLFEQQSAWAFESDYVTKLKQYAALLGVSGDKAEECMNNELSERVMFIKVKEAADKFEISSTPSFVILPTEETLTGAQSYSEISKRIEAILKGIK